MAFASKYSITIDHTKCGSSDSTNFPVLVSGTYAGAAGAPDLRVIGSGGGVQNSSGFDVGFYSDSALTTKLAWEVERWISTTGEVDYWVNIPTVSHTTDTVFYLAYGDATIFTDQSNKTGTWNSDFQIVNHLPNGTVLSLGDSTTHNLGAINHSSTATAGKVAGAAAMSGTKYYEVTNGSASISGDNTHAIAIWVKSSSFASQPVVWSLTDGTNGDAFIETNAAGTQLSWGYRPGATGTFRVVNADISDGAWHRLVGEKTGTGDSGNLYLDGNLCTTASGSLQSIPTFTTTAFFVGSYGAAAVTWQGSLDEFNVSNVVRGADWWKTEFNNQNSPSTFYTLANTAGGGSRTSADTAGGTDAATRIVHFARTTSDTAGGTDVATRVRASSRTTADTAGATDSATRAALSLARTSTDTAGATDAATRIRTSSRTTADTVGGTESATRAFVEARTATDTAGATDAATRALTQSRTSTDTAGGTDAATQGARVRTSSDSAGATDTATRALVVSRTSSDAAGGTDTASRVRTSSRTTADTAGATDGATRAVHAARTGADTCGGTDATSGGGSHSTSCSDTSGGTDSAGRLTAYGRTSTDIAGASDSVARILHAARVASDTCGGTDSATARLTIGHFHTSDTAGGTDSATAQHGTPTFDIYEISSADGRWFVTAPSERWLVRSNG